jgi:hypothetical protein
MGGREAMKRISIKVKLLYSTIKLVQGKKAVTIPAGECQNDTLRVRAVLQAK